jgi:signal transduction histidine kinase
MNVLVIESGADATTNLRELLAGDGYGVVAVKSAREAVEHPDWSRASAVLIAGRPPDGRVLMELRELAPPAPVVVLTGATDLLAVLSALRDGAAAARPALRPTDPDAPKADPTRAAELTAREHQIVQAARLAGVGELAGSVAHELNNALATVTLRLEGLRARIPEGDPQRHALEVVDQEVERMAGLVSNLLEFTRAGRGRVSTVDVCDEVIRTIELTDHHLARKGTRVVPAFAPTVPLIQADRQNLRQVLLHLFANAADAMPEGGRVTVRVHPARLADGRPGVVIEVADTGTGIPPDVLPRVMEAFFTTKAEGKGNGLGLSICKRIVDRHGGALSIESRLGAGTTVRIALPLHPDPLVEYTDAECAALE